VSVEVLYFEGCPSFTKLLPRLRELVAESGGDPDAIALRAIETPESAETARFLGSPTVRVDGVDVDPDAVVMATRRDKKRLGEGPVPFVLIDRPGDASPGHVIAQDELIAAVRELAGR